MSSAGTILLVDDEPPLIELVAAALKSDGYDLAKAHSGQQALRVYAQARPDLVLLDVSMPGMGGIATCRELIATYGEECAPVIFFTAKTAPAEVSEGFNAGGADYLAKHSPMNEIRARVRSHLQNHILARQQSLLAEQLSRANTAKNRFIGMAAHDMRNPLVSIRGFAEFLLDGTVGPMPTEQLALVSIIRDTSNAMIRTLNGLLDVATIEAGQLKLQLSSENLVDLIAKSIDHTKIEARKKRTRIVFTSIDAGPTLVLDAEKMKQVIDNLLSNAIRFSPAASVVTVVVEAAPESGTCSFAVRDEGPGIPDAERDRLFRHPGGVSQPATEEKAIGLGLTICGNIVEAHGGTIAVENLPGKGCEFRVTLPLAP